jgi:D-tyrosyl-tRNA(Tyr) deacylase
VDGDKISEIDHGLLLLWGVEEEDSDADSEVLINKILNFRIFSDENLKMNNSIIDIGGEILLVSQFTLAGNFLKGNRPSFINAKDPKVAEEMLEKVYQKLSEKVTTKLGSFGSMMQVGLINDGPSTFVLSSKDGKINS